MIVVCLCLPCVGRFNLSDFYLEAHTRTSRRRAEARAVAWASQSVSQSWMERGTGGGGLRKKVLSLYRYMEEVGCGGAMQWVS